MTTDQEITGMGVQLMAYALEKPELVDGALHDLTDLTSNRTILGHVIAAWIDSIVVTLGVTPVTQFDPTDAATGKVMHLDDVEPPIAWCARAITARVAGDADTWRALVYSLPADDADVRDYMHRILDMLAITLKETRRVADTADARATSAPAGWSGRAAALRRNSALN